MKSSSIQYLFQIWCGSLNFAHIFRSTLEMFNTLGVVDFKANEQNSTNIHMRVEKAFWRHAMFIGHMSKQMTDDILF